MHLGNYHRACHAAAAALTTPDQILILSALHGLLPLDQIIEPYDQRMRDPGSITTAQLVEQAAALGLDQDQDQHVIAFGGPHTAPSTAR